MRAMRSLGRLGAMALPDWRLIYPLPNQSLCSALRPPLIALRLVLFALCLSPSFNTHSV